MDFIVRLFRALAFARRLEIIRLITIQPGLTLGQVASEMGMPMPDASKHLKLLSDHGLIDARPSGRFLLANPGSPTATPHIVLKRVRELMRRHLGADAPTATAEAVCPDCGRPEWATVFEAMCFEFTAYTHLRRLLILRTLLKRGRADRLTIMREVGMSHTAARRQTDKLVRRGILAESRSGRKPVLEIPKTLGTAFRSTLFAGVRDYLISL